MLTIALLALVVTVVVLALFFWFVGERGRLQPSTRAFFGLGPFSLTRVHGYLYGRWTLQYARALFSLPSPETSTIAARVVRWLTDRHHGKVLIPEHARAIVRLDKPIRRRDLEQIVPYPTARDIVLEGPPDIVAYECMCRNARATHCEPTQVCLAVGKPMTDFILEHHAGRARRLDQAEALDLLQAERDRGHVHSAWFKDALDNRFYALCNCCPCCCGGMDMIRKGMPMVASSGYVSEIDAELCTVCSDCVGVCPFDALASNGASVLRDWERCMGCGVCEPACPTGAIRTVRDHNKGIPLDVSALG
jgi:NAD-dependent dihydropyrimidine dehydrogenase PreA subunit